jgi:hypothetical protein
MKSKLVRVAAMAAALVPVGAHAAPTAEAGPDLAERAVQAPLPVDVVTVFSDRARVRRAGPVKLKRGVQVVRAPDLPGTAWVDTVRVSAQGARVLRVETQPVDRERYSIDQVDEWMAALETKGDEMARVSAELTIAQRQLQALSGLNVLAPVAEQHRVGKPMPVLAPAIWRAAQDQLGKRRVTLRARERAAELKLRDLQKAYSKLQRDVNQRDLGGFSDRKVQVLIILEGQRAGTGSLALEYAVPAAFWKPAYDLHFDPDAQTVELQATGRVTQATGEDWDRTQLRFSTAIPGRGIGMPELITWTLGDDKEYVPRPSARQGRRGVRAFAPPAPRPRIAELVQIADREVLARRTQVLLSMARAAPMSSRDGRGFKLGSMPTPRPALAPPPAPPPASYGKKTVFDFDDDEIEGELVEPDGEYMESRRREVYDEPMAMPAAESAPGSVLGDAISTVGRAFRGKRKPSPRSASMALLSGNAWARPQLADRTLPAMTAGGFDYVFDAPVRASVPSQAQGLRVPLASRKYKVDTFYEATPSLAETAYLKAVVRNGSELPILAGPANIFVKGAFSGDAELQTTGPGGDLELPLGADEDIRLTHTVIPQTKTEGLIFTDDVTEYLVKIEIGNYKKRAVTVRVIDQLPKTNNEKIDVELLSAKPRAKKKPDADGLLYWHVDVKPGKTEQVFFRYRIKRPKDWRLYQ